MKSVIVTADDYAMDAGVDAAVLALAGRGVLSAVSAMVLSPNWPEAGRRLAETELDRGLHLDLTSPFAAPKLPGSALPRLVGAAFLGRLDRSEIRYEIERQLDRFEAVMKAPPDFVDGHQHVHQLPLVRDVLIGTLRARYGPRVSRIGVRLCLGSRWRGAKASAIAATGARPLSRLLRRNAQPANTDFAGVYGFSPKADLAVLWRKWLSGLAGERPLIMCHVAAHPAPAGFQDDIRAARLREWQWLGSTGFRELCSELGINRGGWGL